MYNLTKGTPLYRKAIIKQPSNRVFQSPSCYSQALWTVLKRYAPVYSWTFSLFTGVFRILLDYLLDYSVSQSTEKSPILQNFSLQNANISYQKYQYQKFKAAECFSKCQLFPWHTIRINNSLFSFFSDVCDGSYIVTTKVTRLISWSVTVIFTFTKVGEACTYDKIKLQI